MATHREEDSKLIQKHLSTVLRVTRAPAGYETNIGEVFLVGDVKVERTGVAVIVWVRPSRGLWVLLDDCERVGEVEFRGDPSEGSTVCLSAGGLSCVRVELNREHQTVGDLLEQFKRAAQWLSEADELKRNVEARVE